MSEFNDQDFTVTEETTAEETVAVEPVVAEEPKKKGGVAGLIISIVGILTSGCLGLGGILCIVSLIMSIVNLVKKKGKKGLAVVALIISIFGVLSGLGSFVAGCIFVPVMAPQLIKYIGKAENASDEVWCDTIATAMRTAMMDPNAVVEDEAVIEAISDGGYHYVSEIPEGAYRDAVEEILGYDLDELDDQIKNGSRFYFSGDVYLMEVYIE